MFNPHLLKKQFPIFSRRINGRPLVYLDSASTTQKPRAVINALSRYYQTSNANIHRGIHTLSEESTEHYEAARGKIAKFINAKTSSEIIFTKNCTEGINLVAFSWGGMHIRRGDEIIVSALEHHANLVPWQEIARRQGAYLRVIPLTKELVLDNDAYRAMLSKKTKIVCITGQSNVLGVVPPLKTMIADAHRVGARVLVDGAQYAAHQVTNVRALDCDFFAFSAHKMLGPTGVGILYGREELLAEMHPVLFGGDMVTTVTQHKALFREAPWRFEAGTPHIAGVIATGAAIDFLTMVGMKNIEKYEQKLTKMAVEALSSFPSLTLFTLKGVYNSIVSFTMSGVHPHDIATIFNSEGIAIRSGLHCAEPLVKKLGVPATARMSFYLYNNENDILAVKKALQKVIKIFKIRS